MKLYQNKNGLILPLRVIPILENNENLKVCPWCVGKGKLLLQFTGKNKSDERIKCGNCDGVGAVEATWTEKIVDNFKREIN